MKKAAKVISEQQWKAQYGGVVNEHGLRVVQMNRSTNEPQIPPAWELDALAYGVAGFPELFRAAVALVDDFADTNPEELLNSGFKRLRKALRNCQAHDKI